MNRLFYMAALFFASVTGYAQIATTNLYTSGGNFPTSAVVKYAKRDLGCALNVNLNTGLKFNGTAATDDGPCISNFLQTATAQQPVILVLDGAALVSGVRGPAGGNWGIVGLGGGFLSDGTTLYGSGLYQKAGTNDDVIHNGPVGAGCVVGTDGQKHSDPGWPGATPGPAPARGANVILRDFVINGNRGTILGGGGVSVANGGTGIYQKDGNSTAANAQGIGQFTDVYGQVYCWYTGINIMNMNNVDVSGITFYNTSAYNIRFSNAGNFHVEKSVFANTGLKAPGYIPQNGDGIHINGPANDFTLTGNTFATTDDGVALNSVEGWQGTIKNGVIADSTYIQGAAMFRMYTASKNTPAGDAEADVYDVNVHNLTGQVTYYCGLFGLGAPRTLTRTNTMSNIKLSDITCLAPYGYAVDDNMGDLTLSNVKWHGGKLAGLVSYTTTASQTGSLTLNNVTIGRYPLNTGSSAFVDANSNVLGGLGSVSLGTLTVNGARVVDDPGFNGGNFSQFINIGSPSSIGLFTGGNIERLTNTGNSIAQMSTNDALITNARPLTWDSLNSPYAGFYSSSSTAGTVVAIENRTSASVWQKYVDGTLGKGYLCEGHSATLGGATAINECTTPLTKMLGNQYRIAWTSGQPHITNPDVWLSRNGAGSLRIDANDGQSDGGLTLGSIRLSTATGTGNGLACIDSTGKLYRGTATTCP